MKKHEGFTLIELLIVIIVLGILAAYAIPKYMNIDKQARTAVVQSLQGSMQTAAEMVHAIAIATNTAATAGPINVGTGNVNIVAGGYPEASAAGIGAALTNINGFTAGTPANNSITYTKDGAPTSASCAVTYNATANTVPTYNLTVTGC